MFNKLQNIIIILMLISLNTIASEIDKERSFTKITFYKLFFNKKNLIYNTSQERLFYIIERIKHHPSDSSNLQITLYYAPDELDKAEERALYIQEYITQSGIDQSIIQLIYKEEYTIYSSEDNYSTLVSVTLFTKHIKMKKAVVILLENGETSSSIIISTNKGSVKIDKPNQFVSISKTAMPSQPQDIDLDELDALLSKLGSLNEELHFTLYFEGTTLTDNSQVEAKEMIEQLSELESPYIKIIGHTDSCGTIQNNMELGLQRAKVIERMIDDSTISYLKINSESYSELDLAYPTEDEVSEALNKRVEISVY